jgi:antitoxin (DNA-binding transcriptional repressor) of toxin-antitoxin stability system
MQSVNMTQAKSSRSRLVEAIQQGQEREIVITRRGRRPDWCPWNPRLRDFC